MIKRNYILLIITFIAFVFSTACSTSNLNIAAKTIITAQEIYDATMKASADAYAQGLIDDGAKLEIIVIGNLAHDSIALAQAALITFVDASTAENESKLNAALSAVKDNLGELISRAVALGVTLSDTITNYAGGGNE